MNPIVNTIFLPAMPPQNLDELLVHLPGLRRLRSLDANLLRLLLDRQPGTCTWCGTVVPKGRSSWCGDDCVTAFKSRCDPNVIRSLVEKRDAGICQLCGRDTVAAERQWHSLKLAAYPARLRDETNEDYVRRRDERHAQMRALGFARHVWREVDHKTAVVEYGGLCDVSELWLLCGACHAEETALLAERRAKARREAREVHRAAKPV